MKVPKIVVNLSSLPNVEPPKIQPTKNWRLGKRLYITLAVIVAVITVTVALVVTQGNSIGAQTEWSNTYYGDTGRAIQTSDGGYAIAGSNASIMYPAWERAPILIKTDASGKLLWNRTFGTGHVATSSIIQTQDGGFAMSGTNIGLPVTNPVYSGWLIKTDSNGMVQWTKTFGLPLQTCHAIQTSDGNYVVVGYATNEAKGADTVLYKLNAQGTLVWTKTFGGNSSKLFGMGLVEANSGGYVLAGAVDRDGWLAKTDTNGNLQWSQTYNINTATLPFTSIAKTKDGGYILSGGNLQNSWLFKANADGKQEWVKTLPMNGLIGTAVQTLDGRYIAVGTSARQAYVAVTDASGNLQYNASYGEVNGNVSSNAQSVALTDDGFVVGGSLNRYAPTSIEGLKVTPPIGCNVWLAKFPLQPNAEPTG